MDQSDLIDRLERAYSAQPRAQKEDHASRCEAYAEAALFAQAGVAPSAGSIVGLSRDRNGQLQVRPETADADHKTLAGDTAECKEADVETAPKPALQVESVKPASTGDGLSILGAIPRRPHHQYRSTQAGLSSRSLLDIPILVNEVSVVTGMSMVSLLTQPWLPK